MLLKRKVKAGILLYALLMAAIFALLLQFYLGRVLAMERQTQSQLVASQAYLMAEVTQDLATEKAGEVPFDVGNATYEIKAEHLLVTVTLENGRYFSYDFPMPSETKDLEDKEVAKNEGSTAVK